MDFADVTTYFDKDVFTEIGNSANTFEGQVGVFEDEVSSGVSRGRRVLSVAPAVVIPTNRLVIHSSEARYIVATGKEEDYWYNAVIRNKFTIVGITHDCVVGDEGLALAGALVAELLAEIQPLSTFSERTESSAKLNRARVQTSSQDSLSIGDIILSGGQYYQVITNSMLDSAGINFSDANVLIDPMVTADYVSIGSTYDPVTDTYVKAAPVEVSAFSIPAITDYEYESLDSEKVMQGDKILSVLKSEVASPASGDQLTVGGREYSVMNIVEFGTYWSLHCRS